LIFNVVTGLIALLFMPVFLIAVDLGSGWLGISPDNYTLKLALFHTLFNLTGIILMVPFIPRLVRVLEARMQAGPMVADQPKFINDQMLKMPGVALEAARRELLRLFRRAFSLIAQVLVFEPGQVRRFTRREDFTTVPETIRPLDVDELYQRRIKPLHGLILNFLARVSVEGKRAQQLVLLRVASRQLVEAVKDAKHLQKNLVRYIGSGNMVMREEYLSIRRDLGFLLNRLHRLAVDETTDHGLELELAELASEIEEHDMANSSRLNDLIRHRHITPEQATSLMNDIAYSYRISNNLLAMARATFMPFEEIDAELRERLALDPAELRELLAESDQPVDSSP
jgi:phosphate:Na+ symporter